MRLALFQPDIPQNAAAAIRLATGLGLAVEVVEPCGFLWDDRRLRRVGMDYLAVTPPRRHPDWAAFRAAPGVAGRRVVLLTTRATVSYTAAAYRPDDILLLGRESAGVPDDIHAAADLRVGIPMAAGARSLNVVTAAAMVAGEALRQTDGWPAVPDPDRR
ncbi:tRNA (cytidine(34)-2'-O)-methyltransferase [Roseospira navarrensis]|uniref:tRNA (cytidine(34)-2'-O)-methyltransferase n=1 Tax=Roseospira navarrensis TaxID=140058 RepID=A0A7X2D3P0_9PROT|nr:TrmH family RNA methyltransferase [Roseospira navarrensis]MQX37028.1 tRNA methyltransferase [Roseospira navarrensis]